MSGWFFLVGGLGLVYIGLLYVTVRFIRSGTSGRDTQSQPEPGDVENLEAALTQEENN